MTYPEPPEFRDPPKRESGWFAAFLIAAIGLEGGITVFIILGLLDRFGGLF